ncbi:MAG: hypothetical protein IJK29_03380 [Bacteroidales bacterium]|nr:hypothetical protein [Bacteroidales bacterium]
MEQLTDKKRPGTDYLGNKVELCSDGKYRWLYELNMVTNPTIFLTVFKIFFWIIFAGWVIFGFFLYVIHRDWKGLLSMSKAMLLVLAIFAVLTALGVLIVAAMYHGKYKVLFEMDEKGITHTPLPDQLQKAKNLGALTVLAGLAARRPGVAEAGMLSMSKQSSSSEFQKVRRVVARRYLHLIKVNGLLERNQVYVADEDFDFVCQYIKSRCTNAKR